jgi:hypothetical protein
MDESGPDEAPTVPTITLIGSLVTVLAWEMEVGLLLSHWLSNKALDPVGQAILVGLLGTGTLYSSVRSKRDFKAISRVRGQVHLTAGQAAIVVIFMVSFGVIITWLTTRVG